eukprot:scaffold817_cov246-Pinguiococcus_pyrenoidosus.AAC.3
MKREMSEDSETKKRKRARGGRNMTEEQKLERRERNREHAKRSRVRKKFLLESLQKSVDALQAENLRLRAAIREQIPDEAEEVLRATESRDTLLANSAAEATQILDDPDYSLVKVRRQARSRALQTAQQNFVITDPNLPDNPIVFASAGFLTLTGYTLDQVLGRNCRFLQGPDTDPKAVAKIREAIATGNDCSVCLLNYRIDGSTFWNQFFVAALRDGRGEIANYVGVQCQVSDDYAKIVRQEDSRKDGQDDNMDSCGREAITSDLIVSVCVAHLHWARERHGLQADGFRDSRSASDCAAWFSSTASVEAPRVSGDVGLNLHRCNM